MGGIWRAEITGQFWLKDFEPRMFRPAIEFGVHLVPAFNFRGIACAPVLKVPFAVNLWIAFDSAGAHTGETS